MELLPLASCSERMQFACTPKFKIFWSLILCLISGSQFFGCAVSEVEPEGKKMGAPGSIIRPPSGPQTGAQTPREAMGRRFLEDSDSESLEYAPLQAPDSRTEKEKRDLEFKARSTDVEIGAVEGGVGSPEDSELGRIEQDFQLEPAMPRGPVPSLTLGMADVKRLYKDRKYEMALIKTNHLLDYYPRSPQLLMMKGTLHQWLGQIDLALASYKQAFDYQPSPKLNAQIRYLEAKVSERERLRNREHIEGIVIPGGAESVETVYPGFESTKPRQSEDK